MSNQDAARPAVVLDRMLGDPSDQDSVLSFARAAELDASEEFPAGICLELDRLGLPRYYVPTRYGGALDSYEQAFHLMRALARRDLTVAIAHGKTFLGAAAVWVAGTREQATGVAADILAGTPVCWGLTERSHGSDLLAGEVDAVRAPAGYVVNGEKWLINNATRGQLVCLLARTDPAGGPRGFSLLLVDKRRLGADGYRCLPKVLTHGIRAADISGIAFADARVPADAVVGAPGAGIEILLKAFQLTRAAAGALSLGAADHAFDLVVGFLAGRDRFGGTLLDLPKIRAELGQAYAMTFVAEALGVVACRAIHTLPGEMSVLSAATKYLVPTLADEVIARLGELLGVRAYLTGEDAYAHGAFAKLERDHRIVGIFDGSTFINQNALINQFPVLARGYHRGLGSPEAVDLAASLSLPLPEARLDQLSLVARHGCSLTGCLRQAVLELCRLADAAELPQDVAEAAGQLLAATDELHEELARVAPSARDIAPETYALAHRFALCLAGAACVHVWLRNRSWARVAATAPWRDARWLHAGLVYLLTQLRPGAHPEPYAMFGQLVDAVGAGRASLVPTGPESADDRR